MRVMAPAAIPVGAVVSGTANLSPTPGCNRVTMTRPRLREKSEAIMNQPSVLKPMRPTVLLSPILAMPTVRVVKTSSPLSPSSTASPVLGSMTSVRNISPQT